MIIALAGHVDHGKTALIRALTGIETDRLPEEQKRGMTIDLGFAYLHESNLHGAEAPSIGFVDVPGHERFLANMLAGVLGIDSVLLVVAADDGIMPQTREHLSILSLTDVRDISAVITKIDAVDPARVEEVAGDVATLLAGAGCPEATVYRVSSLTGVGIAGLRDDLLARARNRRARPVDGGFRMAIDRRFTLQGIGLVVTGTVIAGQVGVGETLTLSPPRLSARVRAMHVQDRPAEVARAGDRCALAIAGPRIEASRVRRGHWLVAPELHAPTSTVDLHLRVAEGQRLRHGPNVQFHAGAGHVSARALVLAGGDMAAGDEGFVRAVLAQPAVALHGDRVALRDEASGRILAGGLVVDPFPSERRVARGRLLDRLLVAREVDAQVALERLLAVDGSVELERFARSRNLSPETLANGVSARVIGGAGHRVIVAAAAADAWRARLLEALAQWHAAQPDSAGPSPAVLLRGLAAGDETNVAEAALADLIAEGTIHRAGSAIHLPSHEPRLADADEAIWSRLRARLHDAGLRPPRVRELAEEFELSLPNMEALLERLARFGRLLRVAPNRYFLPETIEELTEVARNLASSNDGFTAAEFNRQSGIGRNLTIELLEFLDRSGATLRVGEVRHLGD